MIDAFPAEVTCLLLCAVAVNKLASTCGVRDIGRNHEPTGSLAFTRGQSCEQNQRQKHAALTHKITTEKQRPLPFLRSKIFSKCEHLWWFDDARWYMLTGGPPN